MRGIYLQLKLNLHLYVLNYGIVKHGLLTSHIGYFCTVVSLEISFLFCLKNNSFTWHGIPLSNCGRGLFPLCRLPTAPAAVLAAPWGPPLSVVGAAVTAAAAAVTAARAAAWRASLVSGSARGSGSASRTSSSLGWRELAGEP